MKNARISVIVPNYNHAQFLPRCLAALLNQPVLPYEIIVVDDASTDNSLDIVRTFAEKHSLIRVFPNERNLGVCLSMNRGMELAQGDWVMFPAADDEVRPGVFEQAMWMLRTHPQAGVFSGVCEWRDEAAGLSWHVGGQMPKTACFLSPAEMITLGRSGRLVIAGQNAVYKKSALVEAGGWISELRWFTDWFGAYVVGFRHGMCHVPEVLSVFNLHPTSYFNTARSQAERREVLARILALLETEKYADVVPLIQRSAMLGGFGWPILRVALGRQKYWKYLSGPMLRQVARRSAEATGRKLLPHSLARWCVKTFYGKR